jgi:amino acid adenylation domain-containing protein
MSSTSSSVSVIAARPSAYARELCVHQLLEVAAQDFSQSVAVAFGGASLSYAELHARANQLAHRLQTLGVKPDSLVGVYVERSLEMVVALLGVLKSGAAYVPLDPSYGSGRIQYVLDEARVRVLITQESLGSSLPATSAEIICLDPSWRTIASESNAPVVSEVRPENLAYVIYTSGSTGKPKGVQLEHRSVVNFLYSMRLEPGLSGNDTLLAVTTLSFDIAGLEIFLPLAVGAKLVVAPRQATYDGHLLKQLLAQSGVTVMQATPTTWRLLFECGWTGDPNLKVLIGGEAVAVELARRLAAVCGPVWNMYGPTETTIWSSLYRITGRDQRNVPIGTPIANTSLYVLDGNRQPVAIDEEGELYIGGEGLARGYFERPELTTEKFVPDPFSSQPGARMYRTGDLVRVRDDGNVEFLGRLDHQVKVRGFRIELGEIEAVLEQHPAVQQGIVAARDESTGEKHLVAYVVPAASAAIDIAELRQHLRKQLPDYMVPSAFVRMQQMPLTPNGKVDRKALPSPRASDYRSDREYVSPRDFVEKKLAKLWEEVLGVNPVGATDNFFDLGGRSLLAARLFIKIAHKFGKELPLTTLIQAPSVELLANELRASGKDAAYPTLVPMRTGGKKPPFFCVHGGAGSTLFLHRLAARMDSQQPFYGIEPEGLDGRKFQRTSVEQMAAHYLLEMRKVQPTGPYHFGGYCFGGIVAFEMAQQLQRQGEKAALVALFTAPLRFNRVAARGKRPAEAAPKSSSARLATLMKSPARVLYKKFASLATKTRLKLMPAAYRSWLALGWKIPPAMRTLYVARTLLRAEQEYRPKCYEGVLFLFHGADYAADPNLGWDGLAAHLEHRIIGDSGQDSRRDLMNEPLVQQTARELEECIALAREAEQVTPAAPAAAAAVDNSKRSAA